MKLFFNSSVELMLNASKSRCATHGWLDSLAISMAVVCAVHCLLTPILLILFPILATTFWVQENFHLWMLLFVLPTTGFAMFLGCRKHKDAFVIGFSVLGLACLLAVSLYESFFHLGQMLQHSSECVKCTQGGWKTYLSATTFANMLGGSFLAGAHVRNYRLCRRLQCSHN